MPVQVLDSPGLKTDPDTAAQTLPHAYPACVGPVKEIWSRPVS